MTDKDYGPHETWCDTQNNISDWCNCLAGSYIEKIDDLTEALRAVRDCLGHRDPKEMRGGALKYIVIRVREIADKALKV